MGRKLVLGLFSLALLASCGDASQSEDSPAEIDGKQARWPVTGGQPRGSDFQPESSALSSQFLLHAVTEHSEKQESRSVMLSSGMGHLPELIYSAAEELGLVADSGSLSLTSAGYHLPQGLRWQKKNSSAFELSNDTETNTRSVLSDMNLTLDGIPVYNAHIKMLNDDGNATWLTGTVPLWASQSERPMTTPFSLSEDEVRGALSRRLGFAQWRFKTLKKAYLAKANEARAIFLVTVSAEHRSGDFGPSVPLEAALDADTGELLWQRPLAMHIDGTAQVHKENIAASAQLENVTLPDLQVSGSLVHSLFNVYNCQKQARHLDKSGTICRSLANDSQNSFNFPYTDSRYDEVIAYAAITSAMEKFRSWDTQSFRSDWEQSKWPGSRSNFGLIPKSGQSSSAKQLNVFVNTLTKSATTTRCNSNTTPDNAQYLWAGIDGGGQPEILIGYGGHGEPCGTLKELGKDFDVVMHEFGHHAVFRGLSNTSSQSVALHEGYADYLTYAVSGNNLLAENSLPGQVALRQGNIKAGTTYFRFKKKSDNTYHSVKDYLAYPHLVGEFWSGILWEMRTELGRAVDGSHKMDKIVWDSIDLLKSDAVIADGVSAISESAKRYAERFADDIGALQGKIHNIFVKYEFASIGNQGELIPTAAISTISTGTTKSKKIRWSCGEVASMQRRKTQGTSGLTMIMAALLIAPLGLSGAARLRQFSRVTVRRKKTKRLNNN